MFIKSISDEARTLSVVIPRLGGESRHWIPDPVGDDSERFFTSVEMIVKIDMGSLTIQWSIQPQY